MYIRRTKSVYELKFEDKEVDILVLLWWMESSSFTLMYIRSRDVDITPYAPTLLIMMILG